MLNANDVARVFETLLVSPGMSEMVKIDAKISRADLLLLYQVIDRGLSSENGDKNLLLAGIPKDKLQGLKIIADEFLHKGGLTDFNENLKSLGSGK